MRNLKRAFTLIELLVSIGIISVLAGLIFSGWSAYMGAATRAKCSSNLRQLGAAVNLYMGDYNGYFPPYVEAGKNGQRKWFFGLETTKAGTAEGKRNLNREAGPLYPYIQQVGTIEVCPGFKYENALYKAKFKGASYGYGYNWALGGKLTGKPMNVAMLNRSAGIILLGDCGQVNTFQAPASAKKPMIEEFYILDEKENTVHFRHSGTANILFVDGHIEVFKPLPGTADKRIKGEIVGRISKAGDTGYFQ